MSEPTIDELIAWLGETKHIGPADSKRFTKAICAILEQHQRIQQATATLPEELCVLTGPDIECFKAIRAILERERERTAETYAQAHRTLPPEPTRPSPDDDPHSALPG